MPLTPPPVSAHMAAKSSHAIVPIVITIMVAFAVSGAAWRLGFLSFSFGPSLTENAEASYAQTGTDTPDDLEAMIQGLQEIAETGSTSVPIMMEQNGEVSTSLAPLREGVYALIGRNSGQKTASYTGTVTIVRRENSANIYELTWKIAGTQTQYGVGILQGGILSVGYYDYNDDTIQDAGAVGYFLLDDSHLEGEWTSVLGGDLGIEQLSWQGPAR